MFNLQIRLAGWGADTPPEHIARVVERLVEALALADQYQMEANPFPALEGAPVRYDLEGVNELFDDATMVLARRSGDCDDLCAYRLGELWASKVDPLARAVVTWQYDEHAKTEIPWQFHVQVRRSNGVIEDPSAELGMGWLVSLEPEEDS